MREHRRRQQQVADLVALDDQDFHAMRRRSIRHNAGARTTSERAFP
jgi:hypothetical protein